MAETTADVRRDIELTRERMSTTLSQLEQKLNLMQVVRDHPWPALGLAVGTGFLLSGSGADVKAAAAATRATQGTSTKLGGLLDELAATLIAGVTSAFHDRVDHWVGELKHAIGAPAAAPGRASRFASTGGDGGAFRGGDGGKLGAAAESRGAAGNAPLGSVDRQLLGVDESAQSGAGGQTLGTDLAAQSGAPRANPPLAH